MPEVEIVQETDLDDIAEPRGIKRTAKREIDKKAEKLMDKATLPKISNRIDGRQWQEYSRLLTPEMWNRLALYVYRTFPVIIRQLSDPRNDNNIGIVTETQDIENYIRELCGGGKYRIDVNDSGKKISEIRINLPIHECEPKLDYREIDLFAKENQAYIQSLKYRGILGEDGKPKPGGGNVQGSSSYQPASISGQDLMGMFDKMMVMMSKMGEDQKADLRARIASQGNEQGGLANQFGALLLERMKQENPQQAVQGFAAVIAAMKDVMLPRVENNSGDVYLKMLDMQQKHSEQMLGLLKEMKANPGKPDNMLQSVEAAIGIAERLKDLGGGGSRGTAEVVLDYVKEIGLPILQYGTRIFEVAKMGQAAGKPMQTKPGATISGPKQLTASELVAQRVKEARANGKEGEKVEDKPIDATEITEPSEEDMMLTQAMSQAGRFFVKFLNEDKTGADLALALIDLEGKAAYSRFAAFGEEKLVAAAKSIPELWEALSPFGESNIKQFAEEFCHYEEYLEPEEEEVPKPEKKERKGRIKE